MHYETVIVQENEHAENRAIDDHCADLDSIGSGLYGTVYGSEITPYVVKIFRAYDLGYLAWLKVITELAGESKYFPKVHKVILYKRAHTEDDAYPNRYVVYLEKLKPFPRRSTDPYSRRKTADKFSSMIKDIANQLRILSLEGKTEDAKKIWDSLREPHRDLMTALLMAAEQAQLHYFDLHSGNFMSRNGTVVITDPLA